MTEGREERFKRWKLDSFTEMIDRFEEAVSAEVNHKLEIKNDYTNILANIAGKAIMTSREIICLLSYGMPDGALALARNLYEQFIILGFFELHKADTNFADIVEDFYTDNEVARIRPLVGFAVLITPLKAQDWQCHYFFLRVA